MVTISDGGIAIRTRFGRTGSFKQTTDALGDLKTRLEAEAASCDETVDSGAPAPESAVQVSARTAKEALAELTAKLQAVLMASADWDDAIAATRNAVEAWLPADRALYHPIPHTSDKRLVEDFLTKRFQQWRRELDCRVAMQTAKVTSYKCQCAYRSAFRQLQESLSALLSEFPDLSGNDVVLAARFRVDGSRSRDSEHEPGRPEEWPSEPEYRQELDEIKERVLFSLVTVARARKSMDKLTVAIAGVNLYDISNGPSHVKTPVRASLEELHRYIRQITDWLSRRQPIHEECADSLSDCRSAVSYVSGAGSLKEVLAKFEALDNPDAFVATREVSIVRFAVEYASQQLASVAEDLDEAISEAPAKLDAGPIRPPAQAEQSKIARGRELILAMAMAMAKHRECEVSVTAAANLPGAEMSKSNWYDNPTWDRLVAWWEARREEWRAVDRTNLICRTKVDLTRDALTHYEELRLVAVGKLRRFLLSNIPDPKHPPCDELRMILNAAAYIWCRETKHDTGTGRPGVYPIF